MTELFISYVFAARHATQRRSAFTLVELAMSVLLLAILMTTSAQMIHLASRQQKSLEHRAAAMLSLQAVAELVTNTPWDQLTAESVQELTIPEQLKPTLSGAKLSCELTEETEPPAKRINMTLTSGDSRGQQPVSVRLTVWVFPPAASSEP
jgi:hypothetical protein